MKDCEYQFECTKQRLQAEADAGGIKCPKCGYEFEGEEFLELVTTFGGEDGPQDIECYACDAFLMLKETVVRTFEVTERKDQ